MIREMTELERMDEAFDLSEEEIDAIEITEEEQRVWEEIDFKEVWKKIAMQLPICERKCWKVTDKWGNTIKRYLAKEKAEKDCMEKNGRALEWNLKMSYRVDKDNGYD